RIISLNSCKSLSEYLTTAFTFSFLGVSNILFVKSGVYFTALLVDSLGTTGGLADCSFLGAALAAGFFACFGGGAACTGFFSFALPATAFLGAAFTGAAFLAGAFAALTGVTLATAFAGAGFLGADFLAVAFTAAFLDAAILAGAIFLAATFATALVGAAFLAGLFLAGVLFFVAIYLPFFRNNRF